MKDPGSIEPCLDLSDLGDREQLDRDLAALRRFLLLLPDALRLRALAKAFGVSQPNLAKAVGAETYYMERLLGGVTRATFGDLIRVRMALGLDPIRQAAAALGRPRVKLAAGTPGGPRDPEQPRRSTVLLDLGSIDRRQDFEAELVQLVKQTGNATGPGSALLALVRDWRRRGRTPVQDWPERKARAAS